MDASQRFFTKFESGPGCWEWTAYRDRDGYGLFKAYGRTFRAHRLAYEMMRGLIPEGKQLDHLCKNRACVNPWHLEIVTPAENIARGEKAQQTHCKRGHEFTPENTYVYAGKRTPMRHCRKCRAMKEAARRARLRS